MAASSSSSAKAPSNYNERIEPRLLAAVEQGELDKVTAIIEAAKAENSPTEHLLLRIGLVRAAERGNASAAQYFLEAGAKPDGGVGNRVRPLLRAAKKNHVRIVRLLLQFGAYVNVADKFGRTALITAALDNHFEVVSELLKRGADVNWIDRAGQNVLHHLAADKECRWGQDIVDLLLRTSVQVDQKDELRRIPLHWAAVTGKKELCEALLTKARQLTVNAVEARGKTSLHLASRCGCDDIVEVLLKYGADVTIKSDGGWTALHNACKSGNTRVITILLGKGAEINAKLSNGMTPLHIAAQAGHEDVVKLLLDRRDIDRTAKDVFGDTPFLIAARNKWKDLVKLLAPFDQLDALSEHVLGACNGFTATIIDFGNFYRGNRVSKMTIFDLLYGREPMNPQKVAYNVLPKDNKSTSFRWIHLPANNISWIKVLLDKIFIEEGASDIQGYMGLLQSLSFQHSGKLVHSRFMTPTCRATPRARMHADDEVNNSLPLEAQQRDSSSNIFFCVPYLHYETDSRRSEMQAAIKRAESLQNRARPSQPIPRASTWDEMLIRGYLSRQDALLHVRRTLDQSFYHNVDTQARDRDQVIYRYQLKNRTAKHIDPKIFMVDQLWMWVLGEDLIITSFPQRWQQEKNDSLNVVDTIVETINSGARDSVRNVHDLAMTVTECCLAAYDRLCVGDNEFQFLDMFESSIGDATNREDILFKEFSAASRQASAWLQQQRHGTKDVASTDSSQPIDPSSNLLFVDKILDISQETMLLAEMKDIRDELNMIAAIFETQRQILPELESSVADIYGARHSARPSARRKGYDVIKKRFRDQIRDVGMRLKELDRMDRQSERVYRSITELLDLKQKQDANAFEGRMARDQAESTARQSQIIMVFTIVTIIFLPLNFIAAFFAINIREFPRSDEKDGALPLAYVSKYTFGVGFAVSVPMIVIALSLDGLSKFFAEMKRIWGKR